jgi:hypothetical protein
MRAGIVPDCIRWQAAAGSGLPALPIPPFEFENWAVIALDGIPNKVQVGDIGVDGRIFPVSSSAAPRKQQEGELGLKERWYPNPGKTERQDRPPGH